MRANGSALLAVVALAAAVGAAGCAGSAEPSAGRSATSTTPTTTTSTGQAPFSGMVDIGGGRQIYLECTGTGSPTVVLEAGDEDDTGEWASVIPGLIRHTRACAYDRLGTGRSDPATGCRTMKDLRGDLEAVLRAGRVDPPYVLVGTSGGGYLIAGYAMAHPAHVAGMVIADTAPAINLTAAPAALQQELKCTSDANVEHREYAVVEHQAWDHRRQLGEFPLTVISNDYGAAATNNDERTNVTSQAGWLVLSPKGRQVVVTTGHNVPQNEADLVVKEILSVVRAARAS